MGLGNEALPKNNVDHSDLFFDGPVILPYILNSIPCENES